jgi:rhodanese-related sulfurtransferase
MVMDVGGDDMALVPMKQPYDALVAAVESTQELLAEAENALAGQPVDPMDPDFDGEKIEQLNERVEELREELNVCKSNVEEAERNAVVHIQGLWRSRESRRALHKMLMENFEKVYDHDSGSYFYYNKKTGVTSWDKPKCLAHDPFGDDIEDVKEIGRSAVMIYKYLVPNNTCETGRAVGTETKKGSA